LINDTVALEAYATLIAQQFLDGLNAKTRLSISSESLRNRNVDKATMRVIHQLSDPLNHGGNQTDVNRISARWNEERDKFLIRSIGEVMIRGKKPYIIFGASHAIHCEPALRKLAELVK
jgi:hypothetical protein